MTSVSGLTRVTRSVRQVERLVQDLDDRLYALEEHFLGETLEDGKVYVKRRYPSR